MTAHFRILEAVEPDPSELECASGDAFLVSHLDGHVLLTIDDVDSSPVPTAQLTFAEARRLGRMLLRHAGTEDRRKR